MDELAARLEREPGTGAVMAGTAAPAPRKRRISAAGGTDVIDCGQGACSKARQQEGCHGPREGQRVHRGCAHHKEDGKTCATEGGRGTEYGPHAGGRTDPDSRGAGTPI